ncbi:uncharacterized protein LOC117316303 [Pecten maximus]|uniref:uncharacterized protein LOC117316303 n=1 Tax=Pecten maximus TaxID=6579 RepID=UPI001458A43D|nr:uncharacterized protein LOC117316303 [Pecten maximus]
MLTLKEEEALVAYVKYIGERGFPLNSQHLRSYVLELVKRADRHSLFNLDKGPSDKWCLKFIRSHPELSEKTPQIRDKGRTRMSNQTVMDDFFKKYVPHKYIHDASKTRLPVSLVYTNMAEAKVSEITNNSTRDLRAVPDEITFGFVENAIKTSSSSTGSREVSKGYKYFSEKYIYDIRVHQIDQGCLIRARSYRSQRKNEAPHDVEVVIRNGPSFDSSSSKCSCAIGSGGCCGHIAGVLHSVAHMKTTGVSAVPCDVAKTSLPQTWHIPRGEKIGGSVSSDVTLQGYDPKCPQRQTRGLRSTLYNPIPSGVEKLDVQKLCENLYKVDKTCLFLTNVSLSSQQKEIDTKYGKFPKGSPLATQQRLRSDFVLNILNAGDFPKLPMQNLMVNELNVVLEYSKNIQFNSLIISETQSLEIEESTRLQSQNPKWHRIRRDRITASVAGDIVKRQKEYDPLIKRLQSTRKVVTANMRYGIASEPVAANAYVERLNGEVNIYPSGLVVSPWSPWLAASPDRKVYCPTLNPKYGLLEIKCPVNPLSECQYLTKDENGYKLKERHNYFYQVMMQMAVTGMEWCHFFVWTPEESHLELILFNTNTWKEMKEKLDDFFFYHYLS